MTRGARFLSLRVKKKNTFFSRISNSMSYHEMHCICSLTWVCMHLFYICIWTSFSLASHFVIILFDHFVWPTVKKSYSEYNINWLVLELDKNEMISIQISHSEQGSLVTWPNLATTAPCTIANINWNSINLNFVGMHVASRECLL